MSTTDPVLGGLGKIKCTNRLELGRLLTFLDENRNIETVELYIQRSTLVDLASSLRKEMESIQRKLELVEMKLELVEEKVKLIEEKTNRSRRKWNLWRGK